jgi:hypothetical protein
MAKGMLWNVMMEIQLQAMAALSVRLTKDGHAEEDHPTPLTSAPT